METETNFTPGPWDWDGQILVRRIQAGEGASAEHPHLAGEWDEVILGVLDDLELASDFVAGGGREYCDWSVSEANAHLIAAAPDLYEALEDAVSLIRSALILLECGDEFIARETDKARATLAKARGES